MNIAKFLRHPFWETSANDCFCVKGSVSKWVSYLSSTTIMFYVLLFTVLKRHSICDELFSLIFFFFCYIVILLVNNNQNILTLLKLNPLCHKKTAYVKKSFDLFLLCVYDIFFLVLGVLYERGCSTKGAAHPLLPCWHYFFSIFLV